MFIRRCWYVAAWSDELPAGALIARTIANEPLVLYRDREGKTVVFEDRCCHRLAPLSKGRLEGDDLRCMYHGLKFNPEGVCIEVPGQSLIPPKARVRRFPAVEKHSWIWIWLGEPALADEALIPPAVGVEDARWNLRHGQMDYDANYQLINDNLTDFSHLSYVHANSFGTSEEFARTRPAVTRLPRGIRVQRWVTQPLNEHADSAMTERAGGRNEQWQSYDFLAPGVLLMYSAFYPPGTAEKLNRREPGPEDGEPVMENFTSQAVTPMTARTSRYFYSWGPRAGADTDETADMMIAVAQKAFAEDKEMIEAQQRIMDCDPTRRELLLSADLGPVQMRRAIDELIAAEPGDPPRANVNASER